MRKKKQGFGGRMFLEKAEYETYLKRPPVRYITRRKNKVCEVCGGEGTKDNPLQHAHLISFLFGVKFLGLTPDFLDDESNIQTAHKKDCNSASEVKGIRNCLTFLIKKHQVSEIPSFLDEDVLSVWRDLTAKN